MLAVYPPVINTLVTLAIGLGVGYGIAHYASPASKERVRVDQVTLSRTELEHVARAIDLLKDHAPTPGYTRYEADSGAIAFECPTTEACNLEVPARARAAAPEVRVTRTERPLLLTSSATVRKKKTPDVAGALAKLGLKNGDVITAINGVAVPTMSEAMTRLAAASEGGEKVETLSVLRDGKSLDLVYHMD